jgi:glutamate-1-semialdehyde 2,1-aminomutase
VIIEPIPANNGLLLQDREYLLKIRELCDEYKSLLIFDEVISGFRVGFEGASGYYDIQADLLTFGKIIGGGLPVGAFGGRKDIMAHVAPLGNVYQAGTLSANPLAISAGIATLKELLKEGFYEELEKKTEFFLSMIRDHISSNRFDIRIQSIGSIFWFNFGTERISTADQIDPSKMELFKGMHKSLLEKGIYFGPSGYEVGFISSSHSYKILEKAAHCITKALDEVLLT